MKKILLLTFFLMTLVNADVFEYTYVKSYFDNGGKKTAELRNMLENDEDYKLANMYLDEENMQSLQDVYIGDPEKPNQISKEKKRFPNWAKAMPLLIKSAKENDNPVSAYVAIYGFETLYGINRNVVDFGALSKILYDNEKNICQSYLYYSISLIRGYGYKVNKNKAKLILSESQNVERCKKGWISNVLASYMMQVK